MKVEQTFTNQSVLGILAGAMVVSGLGYFAAAPFIALYVVMAAALAGLAWSVLARDRVFRDPSVLALAAGIGLIAVTIPFVWQGPDALLGVVIFLPLLITPGVVSLIEQDRRWLSPYALPLLALIGVVAAAGGGMFEYALSNGTRVGMGNNPIHFGGIATILGFVALTGLVAGRSPWRAIFLLGPVAGLIAAVLSGSRGPLLAWGALAIISLPFLAAWFWRNVLFWIVIFGAAQVVTVLYFTGFGNLSGRLAAGWVALAQGTGIPGVDPVRAVLYGSAIEQFKTSPVFGHGIADLMALARPRLEQYRMQRLENLHSDIADFAVTAGSFGLAAYVCFLAAPILILLRPQVRAQREIVLGCILLPASFAALGLTNAMFGVLAQTVLYAFLLGMLIAKARLKPDL